MVTLNQYGANGSVYFGLGNDSKPSGDDIQNGSCFIEMDDSKIYFYDAVSSTWLEWGAST